MNEQDKEMYSQLDDNLKEYIDVAINGWKEVYNEEPGLMDILDIDKVDNLFEMRLVYARKPKGKIKEALNNLFSIGKYLFLLDEEQKQQKEVTVYLDLLVSGTNTEYTYVNNFTNLIRISKTNDLDKTECFTIKYNVDEDNNVTFYLTSDSNFVWKLDNAFLRSLVKGNYKELDTCTNKENYNYKSTQVSSDATILNIKGVKITIESST